MYSSVRGAKWTVRFPQWRHSGRIVRSHWWPLCGSRGVHDFIVDPKISLTVVRELRKETAEQTKWSRDNIVCITARIDWKELYSIDIMGNRTLLNNVSPKGVFCLSFLDVLRVDNSYDRSFDDHAMQKTKILWHQCVGFLLVLPSPKA